jgi:hypothetical protein
MFDRKLMLAGLAVFLLGLIFLVGSPGQDAPAVVPQASVDPLNLTYDIERIIVPLTNGRAEQEAAPGSAAKLVTQVFGQAVYGDLSGDGAADAAMIVTQEMGGSGIFYYLVAAIATEGGGENAGNAIFLGDRIAPQNISIENGLITVRYADRATGESFAVEPHIDETVRIHYVDGGLQAE